MDKETDTAVPEKWRDLEQRLQAIEKTGQVPDSILTEPGAFIRELYDLWVDTGGKISGRYNRHSLKRMKEWLNDGHEIKSLHPKLVGKVPLTVADLHSLLQLIFKHWQFDVSSSNGSESYKPLQASNIEALIHTILNSIFDGKSRETGIRLPSRAFVNIPVAEIESAYELSHNIPIVNSTITISRAKTILGIDTEWTMKSFWRLFHNVYENSENKENDDFLNIWIIDIGTRIVEDKRSFNYFYNTGFLAMSFISLATFSSTNKGLGDFSLYKTMCNLDLKKKKEFWNWLNRRCVVIIQNLRSNEFEDYLKQDCKDLRSIKFNSIDITQDQVLPRSIPLKWASKLHELYGKGIEDLDQTTLSVQLKKDPNKQNEMNVKYLAYALINTGPGDEEEAKVFRNAELPNPGEQYDTAMKMVYEAARFTLNSENERENRKDDNQRIAYAYLTSLGFEAFTIRNFVQIFWSGLELLDIN